VQRGHISLSTIESKASDYGCGCINQLLGFLCETKFLLVGDAAQGADDRKATSKAMEDIMRYEGSLCTQVVSEALRARRPLFSGA